MSHIFIKLELHMTGFGQSPILKYLIANYIQVTSTKPLRSLQYKAE